MQVQSADRFAGPRVRGQHPPVVDDANIDLGMQRALDEEAA
jgi:hypothetical protein